jgi:hypothetical protein
MHGQEQLYLHRRVTEKQLIPIIGSLKGMARCSGILVQENGELLHSFGFECILE